MSDVNVSIGVSLRELQQGLNQAGGMVKDFKQEASKARETAMFLSNAIGSIGGASKGASALVGNLLGGFAMGGPMGLAIGGVNALIGVFKDLNEQEAKAAADAVKHAKERQAAYEEVRFELTRLKLEEAGVSGVIVEMSRKVQEAKKEEAAALKAMNDFAATMTAEDLKESEYADRKKVEAFAVLRKAYDLAVKHRMEVEQLATAKSQKAVEEQTAKAVDENRKQLAERQAVLDKMTNAAIDANRKELQDATAAGQQKVALLKSAGEEELAALDLLAAKKRLLEAKAKTGGAEMPQDLADQAKQEEDRYNKQFEASRKLFELKRQLIEQAKTFEDLAAVDRQAEALAAEERLANLQSEVDHTNKLAAIQEKVAERSEQYAEKMKQAWVSRLQPIANGFQTIFDSILDGGRNMGQVLGNVMKSILSSLVGMLIQLGLEKVAASIASHAAEKPVKVAEVTNAAGVAGAEAAAAMAGIPIVGPALAAAAMAETSALVLSSMLPLAAASGGFDIGNFNPVTQLHAKEMVLPAYLAERIRNMTEMPTQPTNVQVVISAVDSKSVERLFNDNQGALIQSIRTAVRNGRV